MNLQCFDQMVDYVIVGAGSAGCLLAERLSANGRYRVALIEAGGTDKRFWVQVPVGYSRNYDNPALNWCYETAACEGLNGRRSFWPRGKVLGGSSSINAMVYVRGADRDFDDWAQAGNPGWSAAEVRPYFERLETRAARPDDTQPPRLHITDPSAQVHPLCSEFIAAGAELGNAQSDDFNLQGFEGVGIYPIATRGGLRHSSARAFLWPAIRRQHLKVFTCTEVESIVFDGVKAVGLQCTRAGRSLRIGATTEVILAAGAIGSPMLLQRSGVGDAEHLRGVGVTVKHHNPNVGEHLQDHLAVSYFYRCNRATLNNTFYPWHGKLWAGLRYLATRRGELSLSINQAGGFVRSQLQQQAPDLQLYFTPATYSKQQNKNRRWVVKADPFAGFLTSFQPCRPQSRGRVKIVDRRVNSTPCIDPGYLSHSQDVVEVIAGCRFLRKLAATRALAAITVDEMVPGLQTSTDEQLLADFRQRADTVYHPVGSCAMSDEPQHSVVDSQLRVHGLQHLRVIDASVFPNLTSGNTNAPTLMVAEKGAALLLRGQRS